MAVRLEQGGQPAVQHDRSVSDPVGQRQRRETLGSTHCRLRADTFGIPVEISCCATFLMANAVCANTLRLLPPGDPISDGSTVPVGDVKDRAAVADGSFTVVLRTVGPRHRRSAPFLRQVLMR